MSTINTERRANTVMAQTSDTTRRFSRSLAEAFPDVRAYCIERPQRFDIERAGHRFILAIGIVGVAAFVAWALWRIAERIAA